MQLGAGGTTPRGAATTAPKGHEPQPAWLWGLQHLSNQNPLTPPAPPAPPASGPLSRDTQPPVVPQTPHSMAQCYWPQTPPAIICEDSERCHLPQGALPPHHKLSIVSQELPRAGTIWQLSGVPQAGHLASAQLMLLGYGLNRRMPAHERRTACWGLLRVHREVS